MFQTTTANPQIFTKLFAASELKLGDKKPSELGLKHHKLPDGSEYYVFTGTGKMYRDIPRAV